MKKERSTSTVPAVLTVAYILFLVLHIVPVLTNRAVLWGVDQWSYIAKPLVAGLVIVGLAPLVPVARNRIADVLSRLRAPNAAVSPVVAAAFSYAVPLAAASAVFFWFRQATHFLGDGYLWATHMRVGTLFNLREPLITVLYQGFYYLSNASWLPFRLEPFKAAAIVSVAAGLVYLVFACKTAHLISERREVRTFLFLALLSVGSMGLFFGYVEAYAPLAAGVMMFVYFGIRYLQLRLNTLSLAILFAVVVLMHFSAVALIPGFVALIWLRRGKTINRQRYCAVVGVAVVAGLSLLWAARDGMLFSGFFREIFMPFFTVSQFDRVVYQLFSLRHLLDMANEILLICPIAVLAAVGLMPRKDKQQSPHDRLLFFLETIILFYILEFAVYKKILGVGRDWDIFSPMAIPLALYTAITLLTRCGVRARVLSVFVLCIILLHTVPWIGVNAVEEASIERFVRLMKNGYVSDYAKAYAYDELGIFFSDRGDLDRGLSFCRTAAQLYPRNPRYLYNAASLHMKKGDDAEAARLYGIVTERDPDYWQAYYNLGLLYLDRSDLDSARRAFSAVIAIDSTFVPAYNRLALVSQLQGRLEEAVDLYERSIKLEPGDCEVCKALGLLYLEAGSIDRAHTLLSRAVELRRDDARAHYYLGRLYLQRGELTAAVRHLERAVALSPDDHAVRFELANALDRLGRKDDALSHLFYVLERRPDDVRIINNIGVVYIDQGRLDEALAMFERFARLAPDNPLCHVNLAEVYLRLGRYTEAWDQVIEAERLHASVPLPLLEDLSRAMKRPGG